MKRPTDRSHAIHAFGQANRFFLVVHFAERTNSRQVATAEEARVLHTFTICFPNHDAWYLVPQEELLNSANAKFYPHNSKSKGKYEKYRDAFGLL